MLSSAENHFRLSDFKQQATEECLTGWNEQKTEIFRKPTMHEECHIDWLRKSWTFIQQFAFVIWSWVECNGDSSSVCYAIVVAINSRAWIFLGVNPQGFIKTKFLLYCRPFQPRRFTMKPTLVYEIVYVLH